MKRVQTESENPFSLSIGDLMAALLFVVILLLGNAMLQLNKKQQKIDAVAMAYIKTNDSILIALERHFGDNLVDWGAEIDSEKLSVRFTKKSMFDQDRSEIKADFKKILDSFFPEYLKLLSAYRDDIEEIRIEGHTSSEGEYFHNMSLSQDRSRKVLDYCYHLVSEEEQIWMREKATANGLSFSHLIYNETGEEDVDRSRRVEFRVVTKSREKLEEIMRISSN